MKSGTMGFGGGSLTQMQAGYVHPVANVDYILTLGRMRSFIPIQLLPSRSRS